MGLTTVEKVIFLQEVDIFELISSENLALLAAITEELDAESGTVLFREGDVSDSMYIIVDGELKITRDNAEVMRARYRDVVGTWALLDDRERVVTATIVKDSHLLRIDRDDFVDVLADNVQLTQGILKAIAGRLRSLMQRVG
ncbi:cyclic nucleotide-binding domain-containing protein [bacterium]|nr:cyclic nucleotide-binding domain-containing protein [bacterium]